MQCFKNNFTKINNNIFCVISWRSLVEDAHSLLWFYIFLYTQTCTNKVTISAEQALILHQQADGVQLPEEAWVTEAVPQLQNEAADQSGEL